MNKPEFLYIDDEPGSTTEALRDGLNDTNIVNINLELAKKFDDQLLVFEQELDNYDGLILDLRLDDNTSTGLKHTAVSLAQELRSKSAAQEKYKDIPIILCSTDKKIEALYKKDQTSHDLFDFIFIKDYPLYYEIVGRRLKSIAEGYKYIVNVGSKVEKALNFDISSIDSRIMNKFVTEDIYFPTHDLAMFILKQLIFTRGPLIDKDVFAARLGIDIERSEDWDDLINNEFSDVKYTGVFSDGWTRYWADSILNKFKELTGVRLDSLDAEKRVNLLKDVTNYKNIYAAKPIKNSISSKFWTICEHFKKPLDPFEGFKVLQKKDLKPWQEYKYLSFEAAVQRYGKIELSEKDRLEMYKKKFPPS